MVCAAGCAALLIALVLQGTRLGVTCTQSTCSYVSCDFREGCTYGRGFTAIERTIALAILGAIARDTQQMIQLVRNFFNRKQGVTPRVRRRWFVVHLPKKMSAPTLGLFGVGVFGSPRLARNSVEKHLDSVLLY